MSSEQLESIIYALENRILTGAVKYEIVTTSSIQIMLGEHSLRIKAGYEPIYNDVDTYQGDRQAYYVSVFTGTDVLLATESVMGGEVVYYVADTLPVDKRQQEIYEEAARQPYCVYQAPEESRQLYCALDRIYKHCFSDAAKTVYDSILRYLEKS